MGHMIDSNSSWSGIMERITSSKIYIVIKQCISGNNYANDTKRRRKGGTEQKI